MAQRVVFAERIPQESERIVLISSDLFLAYTVEFYR